MTISNAQLAQQMSDLHLSWNTFMGQYRDWLAGTASGGPNSDGKYPLSNALGETFLVDAPAALVDGVGEPSADLLAARDAALEAATEAAAAFTSADAAKATAQTARTDALSARDTAATHSGNAAAAADAAQTAALAAEALVSPSGITDALGFTPVRLWKALTPPPAPVDTDFWLNTANAQLAVYYSGTWVVITSF